MSCEVEKKNKQTIFYLYKLREAFNPWSICRAQRFP